MALIKLPKDWNGVRRANSNYYVESCYSVYYDPDDSSAASYLTLNGFSIYADKKSDITSMLPIAVTIQIDDGEEYHFTSGDTIREGVYSPSMNWMPYAATVSSSARMPIQSGSGAMTIHVTVKPNGQNAFTFNESARKPLKNTLTLPNAAKMRTGRVYDFTFSNMMPGGSNYVTEATLRIQGLRMLRAVSM